MFELNELVKKNEKLEQSQQEFKNYLISSIKNVNLCICKQQPIKIPADKLTDRRVHREVTLSIRIESNENLLI